jgi:6-phosphogluconolactonase
VASAPAGGSYPCHLAGYGDTLVAACYGDGALGVLSARPLALVDTVRAEPATGPHDAQDGPHAHATFALDATTVVSADLGADLLHVHSLTAGVLTRTGSFAVPAGTGPRDFLRLADGRILLLGELGLTVLELAWRGGELAIVDEVALHGAQPGDHAAALTASVDGRFAYAGLRGSNRISVLGVEHGLSALTSVASGGDGPRHHVVDGDVMHVAHERSHSVASFRISENGIPEQIAPPIRVSSPIFLLEVS